MNDFTKEELEYIHEALNSLGKLGWVKSNILFKYKIQSMIDNYCEHTESKTIVNYDNDFVQVCVEFSYD